MLSAFAAASTVRTVNRVDRAIVTNFIPFTS